MKYLTSSTFLGVSHSMISLIFFGSIAMPSLKTTCFDFRIYQYVINEHNKKLVQIGMQHTIHQTHKGSWSISQTEWNYNKLIMGIPSSKSCLVNFLLFNAYLIVSSSQVDIREHYCSLQLIKLVINPWKQHVPSSVP